MGDLVYMFASLAQRHVHGMTCLIGMRRLAETLHPHGVKVTWLVSPESASIAADQFTEWHDRFGDDIAVAPMGIAGSANQVKAQIARARDAIGKRLPWASLTVAAGCHTHPEIPGILADLGFEGLWGFCWEQIEVDGISDRGCPWGFYYMDPGERLRPARGRGVVAMEWTARDLLKSFHSGNPCLYSTDPNDVARGGLCSWEEIDYWKALAANYLRNTRYNDAVFLLQHQEAHEMERSEVAACYTEEDIREAAVMLDGFARFLSEAAGPRLRMMTLPEAARFYQDHHDTTPASYMLWEDAPGRVPNPDYAWSTPRGPWPKTFLYCDRGAQMVFIEGKVEPVCIRNYVREWRAEEYFSEPRIPRAKLVRNVQHTWSREIEILVDSPSPMPYGLALWGDYSLYQAGDAPGTTEIRILPRELLFLRYTLAAGENRLRIRLDGK